MSCGSRSDRLRTSPATMMPSRALPPTNCAQSPTGRGWRPCALEHLADDFAPAGGVGGQQHAPGIFLEEADQRRQRLRGARIELEIARSEAGAGRVIAAVDPGRAVGLRESLDVHARVLRQLRGELGGADIDLFGRQQRPLDVVAVLLIALADRSPGRIQRRLEPRIGSEHQVGGQVVHQAGGGARRTAAGRTRCPAAPVPR